jgi:chemotaxis protein MotB
MSLKRLQKKPCNEASGNNMGWLMTFNDMVTLLMVFFVLIFTLSSLDAKRFKHFQCSLQSALGMLYEGQNAPVGLISSETVTTGDSEDAATNPSQKPVDPFDALRLTEGLEAVYTPKGIQLTLNDRLLFGSGSADLTVDGLLLLSEISRIIKPLEREIRVEGHTDDRPISTAKYPSNWELSTARAIRVVRYLIETGKIAPALLSAAGYADSKPREPNDSEAHRASNRRVEIILGRIPEKTKTGEIMSPLNGNGGKQDVQ